MDERRRYLKDLASQSAAAWAEAPVPPCFAGETRFETKNTAYTLRHGVCVEVSRRDAGSSRHSPSSFVGMRIVGWLMRDDPHAGLSLDWKLGSYAVLWQRRAASEEHSAVALTSSTLAFRQGARSVPPPLPARASRPSLPPPRPLAIPRAAKVPTPASFVRPPPPPSMTRIHVGATPLPAPLPTIQHAGAYGTAEAPTPATPVRRRTAPPPLPARAIPTPSRAARAKSPDSSQSVRAM